MINREKRDLAWKLIHGFFTSEITNDDLMDNYPRDEGDAAIGAIYERLWFFWPDNRTVRLTTDNAPKGEARELIERCIAFLKSDLEYEWPPFQWVKLSYGLMHILGLKNVAEKKGRESLIEFRRNGTLEVWPFIRESDYVIPRSSQDSGSNS
jgi:hypothetical protein